MEGSTDFDTELLDLIQAAREKVESDSERAFLTQTRRMWLDQFPYASSDRSLPFSPSQAIFGRTAIEIPVKPVSAVTAVVALPWTFRSAFDIDKARWERSPNQVSQLERCRTEGVGVADQQVSPGLRDDLLCQVVDFLDGR